MFLQADFCPQDSTVVCVSGDGILRFFRITESQFRPVPMNLKRDPQNYLCHCWLPEVRPAGCGCVLCVDRCQSSERGPRSAVSRSVVVRRPRPFVSSPAHPRDDEPASLRNQPHGRESAGEGERADGGERARHGA